jgi:type I restriction enzyme S subunit
VKPPPKGWQEAALGDVCRIVSGATPKTGVPEYWGGDIAWITPNDLSRDRSQTLTSGERSLTQAGYDACSARIFPAGSVIVSSRAPVGYVTIAASDMCTNQGCKTAVPPDFIDSKYLYWYMVSAKPDLEARASGTTFKEISGKRFAETRIRWPQLGAQRQIVDVLEDHLSRLNAAKTALATARRRLNALRERSILNAITGADELARSRTTLPSLGTHDDALPDLPVGWSWARLGEVADVVGGVTKDAKRQSDPTYLEVPYLRVANVQRGHLRLDEVTHIRVDPRKAEALRLQSGDVLLNEGGDRDKLARGWVWEGQIENCIHQNHVFRARVQEPRLDPYFLSWTANTFGGRWAERNGKQSVNLASISLNMIRKMPVIVPTPGEAEKAVGKLADDLAAISRLDESIVAAERHAQALRQSLLVAAFSGRLSGKLSEVRSSEGLASA